MIECIGQQRCRGIVEVGIIFRRGFGMGGDPLFEFREAKCDGFFDLLGQVEILPGHVGKERVDEVKPPQVFS